MAQAAWPERPIKIVVPYGPGSTPDALARVIFEQVSTTTGQPAIIENRPGGAGMIGAAAVAKATPDGYTLLLSAAGPLVTNTLLYSSMTYDPLNDLSPIALVAETPTILVKSRGVKSQNITDLLQEMKAREDDFAYASAGNGTLGHLSMAYLVSKADAAIPHAPYGGSPQILTSMVADDIQLASLPPLAVAPLISAGRIEPVAVIGPRRNALLPELATLQEQGLDFAPVGWFGVAAPADVPADVAQRIYETIAKALESDTVKAYYQAQGMDITSLGPAAFADYLQNELKLWKPVVEENKISLD